VKRQACVNFGLTYGPARQIEVVLSSRNIVGTSAKRAKPEAKGRKTTSILSNDTKSSPPKRPVYKAQRAALVNFASILIAIKLSILLNLTQSRPISLVRNSRHAPTRTLPVSRLPKQTLHHAWSPKLQRTLVLTSVNQVRLRVMLEANPAVKTYCERPCSRV
jgi:hypothetical protein